jgi:type II secretory pathway pseudopilin PulG
MKPVRYFTGFSIVELVVAILIAGIIAAVTMSRLLNRDSFDVIIAREEIVSILRMAQQRAIGHQDVVVTLQPSGNDLVISLKSDSVNLISPVTTTFPAGLLSADVDILSSCSTPPAAGNVLTDLKPLHVEFGALGDLLSGGVIDGSPPHPVDVTTGMRLCLNNDPVMSICISAAGFAYTGDCDA